MTNEHRTSEQEPDDARQGGEGQDRPDLRGPRGNQETETADVERGREKLDRVITK
jgi:hypothetical protein